jgi:hypothetical protein
MFVQPVVPQGPEEAYLKEIGRTDLTEIETRLRGLMDERPVWVRTALLNQLTPEEYKIVNVCVLFLLSLSNLLTDLLSALFPFTLLQQQDDLAHHRLYLR